MNRRTFFHILVCTGALWLGAMPLFAQSNPTKDTTTVLIIGANGSVAKEAIAMFLQKTNVNLKLFLRNAMRLEHLKSSRVEVVEGDATDKVALTNAMKGVQVVYANLHGKNTPQMAATIIRSMQAVGLKRLIWITSFGVYNEEYQEILILSSRALRIILRRIKKRCASSRRQILTIQLSVRNGLAMPMRLIMSSRKRARHLITQAGESRARVLPI